MLELIHNDTPNIICTQPFGCLPNHVVGKGVIKELRKRHPEANIVAIDYDPGASEVNQLNRIKLMLSTAQKNLNKAIEAERNAAQETVAKSANENAHIGENSRTSNTTDIAKQRANKARNAAAAKNAEQKKQHSKDNAANKSA